jgi:hypothetical protein
MIWLLQNCTVLGQDLNYISTSESDRASNDRLPNKVYAAVTKNEKAIFRKLVYAPRVGSECGCLYDYLSLPY